MKNIYWNEKGSVHPAAFFFFFVFLFVLSFASDQLKEIGVVDEVIWEPAQGETHDNFPIMAG